MGNKTEKRRLGDLGESIACDFLTRRGFEVIERHYLKKWGELDIVAKKGGLMRFIEVKSVSGLVSSETAPLRHGVSEGYRPEDNMHPWKLKRLSRAIQTYLLERDIDEDWQLDLITVRIDEKSRRARVELIENVII